MAKCRYCNEETQYPSSYILLVYYRNSVKYEEAWHACHQCTLRLKLFLDIDAGKQNPFSTMEEKDHGHET